MCWFRVLVLLLIFGAAETAFAGGTETSLRGSDLSLFVDSRWCGGAYGGYYPIRIRIRNTGTSRSFRLQLTDLDPDAIPSLPVVERTVTLPQNATQLVTLSIPMANYASQGHLDVLDASGNRLDGLSTTISFPESHGDGPDRPALLVISPVNVDCDRFEDAVNSIGTSTAGGPPYSGSGRWSGGMYLSHYHTTDHQVIPPQMLPESWVDYSALDIVATSLGTFRQIPAAARAAIINWVEMGGRLLIYDVGVAEDKSKELGEMLNLAGRAGTPKWVPADPGEHKKIVFIPADSAALAAGPEAAMTNMDEETNTKQQKQANKAVWKVEPQTFKHVELMLGRVYSFRDNPFPGAPVDWAWWLKTTNWRWTTRTGVNARSSTRDFFQFLIPGVGETPVLAFVLLITLFTLVIGPVNYFLLSRRKKFYLLVLTIPVIAGITSGSILAYAAVADGFGVKARLRSFTQLDQRTRTAVSLSRISLYAGLAPSDGMHFSPETVVLPIWHTPPESFLGAIDWTDTQHLKSGWIVSRSIAQFLTLNHRVERGRLEVRKPATGETPAEIANGFSQQIEFLLVKDAAENLFCAESIPAGGTAVLKPMQPAMLTKLSELLEAGSVTANPELSPDDGSVVPFEAPMFEGSGEYGARFSSGLLEQKYALLRSPMRKSSQGGIRPQTYLAIFLANPGIEVGVPNAQAQTEIHVIMGDYPE